MGKDSLHMAFEAIFCLPSSEEPIEVPIGDGLIQVFHDYTPGDERVIAVVEMDDKDGLVLSEIADEDVLQGEAEVDPSRHFRQDTYNATICYGGWANIPLCPEATYSER